MKLNPHIKTLGPLPPEMRAVLEDATRSVNLDDPASLTKEAAFFDACNRYDAETEFFNERNNFYSAVMPSKELRAKLEPYLQYLLTTYFTDHAIYRAQVVRNIPGAIVNPHIDPRMYHALSHRVHAVLRTNEYARHVYFDESTYDIEYLQMAPDFIYDFDNITPHAAFNLGTTDRLHIIVDVMPGVPYRRLKALLMRDPNRIPPGVEAAYFKHLTAIETRYGGKDGLMSEYSAHVRAAP